VVEGDEVLLNNDKTPPQAFEKIRDQDQYHNILGTDGSPNPHDGATGTYMRNYIIYVQQWLPVVMTDLVFTLFYAPPLFTGREGTGF